MYVLHNVASNSRNSYVAMTMHIEEVKLYCNRETTKNMTRLISQLSKPDNNLSSINLTTLEELREIQGQENKSHNIINKVGNWFKGIIEDIHDKSHSNDNYYHPQILSNTASKIKNIFGETKNFYQHHNTQEETKTSSCNLKHHNQKDTITKIKLQEDVMAKKKIDYHAINKQETLELKQRLSFKTAEIGINLLGSPNKHLSNSQVFTVGTRW